MKFFLKTEYQIHETIAETIRSFLSFSNMNIFFIPPTYQNISKQHEWATEFGCSNPKMHNSLLFD